MKSISTLSFALLLTGCASAGTAFDWGNARKVAIGTTSEELTALMGKPNSVATRTDGTQVWGWVHVSSNFGSVSTQHASFLLKDGKVIAVPDVSAFQ